VSRGPDYTPPMPNDDYLAIANCRKPEDLERLSPLDLAVLSSRPATQLDLLRLQLEHAEAINLTRITMERSFEAVIRRVNGG
jgi:hypothetical protein